MAEYIRGANPGLMQELLRAQAMKASRGKANPAVVNELLKKLLAG